MRTLSLRMFKADTWPKKIVDWQLLISSPTINPLSVKKRREWFHKFWRGSRRANRRPFESEWQRIPLIRKQDDLNGKKSHPRKN